MPRVPPLLARLVASALFVGCRPGGPSPVPCDVYDATPHRAFAVLPDTQFYACAYADTFEAQTRYLAENAVSLGLAITLHTGDVVDTNDRAQWQVASRALHRLDDHLPYLISSGNHDLDAARGSLLDESFAPVDLTRGGCVPFGFMTPGRVDDAYALVTLRGQTWLFLGLEFGARDAAVAWADAVLSAHPDTPAVLFTHAYLYADDQRYDRAVLPTQPFHPDLYQITPELGIADGQDLWETLVVPHENVKLVLSGHVIPDGIARGTAVRPSGSVVHEVLTNFQTCGACPCEVARGGDGYLRLFELNEALDTLQVRTYSPTLDTWLTTPEHAFDLPL